MSLGASTESLFFTNSDDTAGQASASVSGRLRQLVATIAQVIDISVNDNRAAQDAVASGQGNLRKYRLKHRRIEFIVEFYLLVRNIDFGNAGSVSSDIS